MSRSIVELADTAAQQVRRTPAARSKGEPVMQTGTNRRLDDRSTDPKPDSKQAAGQPFANNDGIHSSSAYDSSNSYDSPVSADDLAYAEDDEFVAAETQPVDATGAELPGRELPSEARLGVDPAASAAGAAGATGGRFRTAVGTATKPFRTATAAVRTQWDRYTATKFYQLWSRRPKLSIGLYLLVAVAMIATMDMLQIWSVRTSAQYDPSAGLGFFTQVWQAVYEDIPGGAYCLNFIALALVYLVIATLINRFWISTAVFGTLMSVLALANKIKIGLRNEPVIPSDLMMMGSGGEVSDSIMSFIPEDAEAMIGVAVKRLVVFVAICLVLQFLDRRRGVIPCSWIHPLGGRKHLAAASGSAGADDPAGSNATASVAGTANVAAGKHIAETPAPRKRALQTSRGRRALAGLVARIVAPIVAVGLLLGYAAGLADVNSKLRTFVEDSFGYSPALWDTVNDAGRNGSLTTFLSLLDVDAMDKPEGYSQAAMTALADKYAAAADEINAGRSAVLTDSTVIFILSESFADPTRVPGISFTEDPIDDIREVMDETTSGLMVAPTYGGGTANIEFQQMTGLNLSNFNESLLSPYQQLLPNGSEFFSFNQMWNEAYGTDEVSIAYHPYYQNFYLRNTNYNTFGFSSLRTLDSTDDPIANEGQIDRAENVSDLAIYEEVIEGLKNTDLETNQFIELITMQNHMPYSDWYDDNQFAGDGNTSTGITTDGERTNIETFTKGMQLTDDATAWFLDELDAIDKPITVVFYGDHLPGIYSTAAADEENDLLLHETEYFIWSNEASSSANAKNSDDSSAITSSNFFMAQAAEHMDAYVSPYLALLTALHEEVPAMARISVGHGQWGASDKLTIVGSDGEVIPEDELSERALELLDDYRLVQYDLAVGKLYLADTGFLSLDYNA
ncbi:LTA synthase family protein [Bifidobacterium choloepi]|uniref:LTA synthase family protein n=1 Tax=Bifidobacterium choloepi TaxID=2614131 RepID=A0A6I5NGB1_9BIFI|nr:LTA synthase family protein [Bifidobacterium choloepi]NEG70334.1 LTA synthase family protein [Bifidobacterium choloepi]